MVRLYQAGRDQARERKHTNPYQRSVARSMLIFCLCSCFTQVIDIEKEIDYGQIEELIEIANEELGLIEYYHGEWLAV